ncbi:EF-hand domain-containing protein [Gillisia sp. CAL575]|uniref:EF-hand domain-containing protein n=1 Tax=Gillisia sp. CAL575 TaxID=985255 RepID=UPI000A06DA03|nr:EF-hand domain-containing protein [Gillisia sp. CAL575]
MILGIGTSHALLRNNEKPKTPPRAKEILKELDTSKDGKLSKEEVRGQLKKDFKKIDPDEDGFISKKELEKASKLKRKERN